MVTGSNPAGPPRDCFSKEGNRDAQGRADNEPQARGAVLPARRSCERFNVPLQSLAGRARADPLIAAAGDIACDTTSAFYNDGLGRGPVSTEIHVRPARGGGPHCSPHPGRQPVPGRLAGRLPCLLRSDLGPREVDHPPGAREPRVRTAGARGTSTTSTASAVSTGPAGERGKGYYSYDVGSWHLIALNSNCDRSQVRPHVAAGSAQEQWLRADLAAIQTACTLAYWHHPRFSSGHGGNNTFMQPFWQALYDAGADVVLTVTATTTSASLRRTPTAGRPRRASASSSSARAAPSSPAQQRRSRTARCARTTPSASSSSRSIRRATTGGSFRRPARRSPTPAPALVTAEHPGLRPHRASASRSRRRVAAARSGGPTARTAWSGPRGRTSSAAAEATTRFAGWAAMT